MIRKAVNHLRRVDPVMASVIDTVGPCRWTVATQLTPFAALARSIVYQQLSGKAAATIYGRVETLFGGAVHPSGFARFTDDELRACGLSRQKLSYLRDFAARVIGGELPIDALGDLPDDDVVGHLTRVKGVGKWTAQMFLMFRLGRPDILPELDLGIRKGVQRAYRLRKLPTPERVLKIGAQWSPYRTIASWYLWRSLEGEAAMGG
jgi:DNA-3-methyladenine glycosylase II